MSGLSFRRALKTVFVAGRWLGLLIASAIVAGLVFLLEPHGKLLAAIIFVFVIAACIARHKLRIRDGQKNNNSRYLSVLFVSIVVAIGILELVGVGALATALGWSFILDHTSPPPLCEEFTEDEDGPFPTARSPDGKWTAEINEETCGIFGGTPVDTYLTIHQTGLENNLSVAARVLDVQDVDKATLRWIDNKTIEVGLS